MNRMAFPVLFSANLFLILLLNSVHGGVSIDVQYPHVHFERMAFGSCNKQNKPELSVWSTIKKEVQPQIWLWNGDAIYSKNKTLLALEDAYEAQLNDVEYAKFISSGLVVDGVWDDHDYGVNDAGKELTKQKERQNYFLNFLESSGSKVDGMRRNRNGVYRSMMFGQGEQKVKVILLDTRTFRDLHLIPSVGASCRKIPILGNLTPMLAAVSRWFASTFNLTPSHEGDMLGEEQWEWLSNQLKYDNEGVAFTILVSSVQVLTSAPVFESWSHFPRSQQRLLALIHETNPKGLVMLSGDVHFAEILSLKKLTEDTRLETPTTSSGCDDVIEVTASGMTHSCQSGIQTKLFCYPVLFYYDKHRFSKDSYFLGRNFGSINIDWHPPSGAPPYLTVNLHDATTGDRVLKVGRFSCPLKMEDHQNNHHARTYTSSEL